MSISSDSDEIPSTDHAAEGPAALGHDNFVSLLRRLPGRTLVLFLADAVNAFGVGVVLPFLLIYLSQIRHLDVRVAALALSLTAISSFASGLVWGALLDRYPHRVVMPGVMILAGIATCLYAVADRAWIAMAVATLSGIAMGGVGPVVRTMFATAVPPGDRALFFGLQFAVFNAFVGLGTLFGGLMVNGSVGHYQLLYAIDGATFLFMAIILVIFPGGPTDQANEAAEAAASGPQPSYRQLLRNPALVLVLATISLSAVCYYGAFQSALPGYLTLANAVSPRGISGAFVINVVVVVLAQLVVMPRLRRFRQTTWLLSSGVLWSISWVLILLAGRTSGTAALILLWVSSIPFAVGETLVTPILAAILNNIVQDSVRGRANALFTLSLTGGAIVGPALTAALLPVSGGVPLVVTLAIGCLFVLIPAGMLRKRLADDLDTLA